MLRAFFFSRLEMDSNGSNYQLFTSHLLTSMQCEPGCGEWRLWKSSFAISFTYEAFFCVFWKLAQNIFSLCKNNGRN